MNNVIIKIGSASLNKENKINTEIIEMISNAAILFKKNKDKVTIVTSGAVLTGKNNIYENIENLKISKNRLKKVLASIGQPIIMSVYQKFFDLYRYNVAQILLSNVDIENEETMKNTKETLNDILNIESIVPIINYNDPTHLFEIKYTDNDNLTAIIADIIKANIIIILSDVDGLYDKYPHGNLIKHVSKIDENIYKMISKDNKNKYGTGGMYSKLKIANDIIEKNKKMYLTNAKYVFELAQCIIKKLPIKVPHTLFSKKKDQY